MELLGPLQETFFQKALIGGGLVALVCGPVGALVVLRRMAFLGDALSHAMIAGVAGGYLFMKLLFGVEAYAPAMLLGSLLAAVLTVGLIGFVTRSSRLKDDTAIGIMYTGVFAGGVVLVSVFREAIHIDLVHFIMGDVLGVADADLRIAALVAALVLTVLLLFFRHFRLIAFDPVLAASLGVPVLLFDYALTTCVSLVVVSAVSMVGVILVVGLLITPAATALLLSQRLHRVMLLAALSGLLSVAGGLYLSLWIDAAGGGAILLFATAQFVVVLFLAPRQGILAGWLRRRRHVPQEDLEDLLVAVLRHPGAPRPAELEGLVPARPRVRERAAAAAAAQGLVARAPGGGLALTAEGEAQARRILRAHRLWESYLDRRGVPAAELHARAHTLEHLHDEPAVAYLDDLLGHPARDPHGREIPADLGILAPGREVPASLLRPGLGGRVVRGVPELAAGARVVLLAREEEGRIWVIRGEDGREHRLSHAGADALVVELEGAADTMAPGADPR